MYLFEILKLEIKSSTYTLTSNSANLKNNKNENDLRFQSITLFHYLVRTLMNIFTILGP